MQNQNDLLIEIGCEELPAKHLLRLLDDWKKLFTEILQTQAFSFKEITAYATPRRLALIVRDLSASQATRTVEKRGPATQAAFTADHKPTPALLGFAKSCGVTVEALTELTNEKGSWLVWRGEQVGKSIADTLQAMLDECVRRWPLPKSMHWGDPSCVFPRPVRWLVVLYGETVLPVTWFNQPASAQTFGHRFHRQDSIILKKAQDYEQALKEQGSVIVDQKLREQMIISQLLALAEKHQAEVMMDEALIEEVTGLVEWPHALLAHFDKNFLLLPREVLISAIREHQKCFSLCDKRGYLMPFFITISNIQSRVPLQVIKGNERVMRARFSDAQFFYEQDRAKNFDDWIEKTKQVIYQDGLGTLFDKTSRLENLAKYLSSDFKVAETTAVRAAQLCKADLMSLMVGEFPELQGIIGENYAAHFGEDKAVAQSLREYYLPRTAKDNLPSEPLSQLLAIIDRIDTLTGIFSIGKKPTGEKDPFALRRCTIGLLRILGELDFPLSINDLIVQALNHLPAVTMDRKPALLKEVKSFIVERFIQLQLEKENSRDRVEAVLSVQDDDVSDILKRLSALNHFLGDEVSESFIQANKRVKNILQQETCTQDEIDESLLTETVEQQLKKAILQVQQSVNDFLILKNYREALKATAMIAHPLANFFEKIMVLCDDKVLRQNRLILLTQCQGLLTQVIDFSKLNSL